MAKKKSGSIAVPFLITIFIGLIIIGGMAFGVYRYFGFGKQSAPPEPTPRISQSVTSEDSHTILLVLDVPEQKCAQTFVLMRSNPAKKQLLFIGIPTNTIAIVEGSQQSMQGSYDRGGAATAAKFVEQAFGLTVDRYMKFDSASFRKICDIFGGVTCSVNADIAGFNNDGSQQYLKSEQIETYVTYSLFKDGETERAFTAASLLSSMVNQADGKRIADSFDTNFNLIINMIESNVTSVDYKKRKNAVKYMFENGSSIAVSLSLDGTPSGNDFIASDNFLTTIKKEYFSE